MLMFLGSRSSHASVQPSRSVEGARAEQKHAARPLQHRNWFCGSDNHSTASHARLLHVFIVCNTFSCRRSFHKNLRADYQQIRPQQQFPSEADGGFSCHWNTCSDDSCCEQRPQGWAERSAQTAQSQADGEDQRTAPQFYTTAGEAAGAWESRALPSSSSHHCEETPPPRGRGWTLHPPAPDAGDVITRRSRIKSSSFTHILGLKNSSSKKSWMQTNVIKNVVC